MVNGSYDLNGDESLDLFRLMKLTNSMKQTQEYIDYINAADARKMSNEVQPLLQEAISKGLLDPNDVFVKENLQIVSDRTSKDRAEADDIAKEARTSANGISARAAGDNFLSLSQPDKAAEMYQLATQKGGVEADRLQMRTGVAFALAGNNAAARENFARVTGKRAAVAKMWLTYLDTRQAAASAPASDAGGSANNQ